jgi:hypothetical protein
MTWNDVVMQIVQYLVPVIGALLVALLGYLVTYISKHQEKLKNDILRDAFGAALAEAHIVGRDAIVATQQQLVDDLKAAAEDGKLTKEEAAEALAAAKLYFITHLSDHSKDVLREGLGPIQNWLDSFLEAKLGEYKGGAQTEVQKLANPISPGLTK